jgi:hypothetical protein
MKKFWFRKRRPFASSDLLVIKLLQTRFTDENLRKEAFDKFVFDSLTRENRIIALMDLLALVGVCPEDNFVHVVYKTSKLFPVMSNLAAWTLTKQIENGMIDFGRPFRAENPWEEAQIALDDLENIPPRFGGRPARVLYLSELLTMKAEIRKTEKKLSER